MTITPIQDLRVLDLTGDVAGAYCTKLLVDAGAEVVKIEMGDNDSLLDRPGLFEYLCAGKKTAGGSPDDWRDWADVTVQTEPLVTTGRVVTVTPFGTTGPWAGRRASEFTLQALCGSMGFRGFPDGAPVAVGGELGSYATGAFAAIAALASLSRPPAHYDVSMLEAMVLTMQGYEWLHASLMGLTRFSRSIEVPSIEPAKDGWVGMTMITGQQWQDFAAMVGQPKLAEDPELCNQLGRWPRRQEVYDLIHPWLAARTVAEVVETASFYRVPMAPLGNGATVRNMDHFAERGVFVQNPAGFEQPRPPWLMSACAPAPLRPCRESAGPGLARRRPAAPDLSRIRILDLTAFWAGPSATFILAALGADVVKVESVGRPDGIRFAAAGRQDVDRWWELSWIFHGANPNKRGITLDLGSDEGRGLFLGLVAEADAVVENFSPRVMDNFGLGWDVLHAANPSLVFLRMPAFGLDGPWRDRVGFAPTMEQLSGMAWVTGPVEGPPMAPRGACDPIAGAHAAFALLAALEHRQMTGQGQLVEVPMVEVALNLTAEQTISHQLTGVVPGRQPQNVVRGAGDDEWLALEESVAGKTASAPVVRPPDVVDNPQLQARGFFHELHHQVAGDQLYAGLPWPAAGQIQTPPPLLGQHNEEILQLPQAQLADLAKRGVIGQRPLGL